MNNYMNLIGKNAKKAVSNKINTKTKNKVLKKYALLIENNKNTILKENLKDINLAVKKKLKIILLIDFL